MPADGSEEMMHATWFTQSSRRGGAGGVAFLVRGYNPHSGARENTSPVNQQGSTTRWHIYKVDLDATHPLGAESDGSTRR